MSDHPSDQLAHAVSERLGDHIRSDWDFAARVWGALVYNEWFQSDGTEGILTFRGADETIGEIRGDGVSFYMEGGEGPPPLEMSEALAAAGWFWREPSSDRASNADSILNRLAAWFGLR